MILMLWSVAAIAALEVRVRPGTPYIEESAHEQFLNFDFEIANPLSVPLRLQSVELRVLDAAGKVIRRDFVDRSSRRHAELDPERILAPGKPLTIFNPFHTFDAGVPLRQLRYRFTFVDEQKKWQIVESDVAPKRFRPKTSLIPPLKGRLLVWDGHDYASHHRRTDVSASLFGIPDHYQANFQRYGFDFVIVDDDGELTRKPQSTSEDFYRNDASLNPDYLTLGHEVLAAGAGRVVELHDGEPDNLSWDAAVLKERETAYGGNYIIIDHGNGEFSWFGHLRQGSVRVTVGQHVAQGEVIANVGASGSSLFPHLHYELRSAAGAAHAEGLPAYFTGFRRASDGRTVRKPARLDTGDIIVR
jgi:hypothetical protein